MSKSLFDLSNKNGNVVINYAILDDMLMNCDYALHLNELPTVKTISKAFYVYYI